MTNEEMCISIQNGDNTLKFQLWDNVSKIYYFLADKFFSNNAEKCTKCGLQRDDIHQLSYFAFEHSIKAFDISKGYAFTTYAKFSLLAVIQSYFCKDTLNRCESLDDLSYEDDEGGGLTVNEIIPDNTAADPEEKAEQSDTCRAVREAVADLPESESSVISAHWFQGLSLSQISKRRNVSHEAVSAANRKGMYLLRRKIKDLRKYSDIYGYHSERAHNTEYIAVNRVYYGL